MATGTDNGKAPKAADARKPICGIIMPISAIDGCSAEHWAEVLSILRDVIGQAGFEANLVSDADDSGIIQKRIIQNVYSNDIVVCDVSGKNPNVMFELGMRLAFDKPTIIVKDDKTDYSFDTAIIEHLTYPRDLRFGRIVGFKEGLSKKLQATHEKAKKDPNYSTFLKNFGEYKVAQLNEKELPAEKYIIDVVEDLRREVSMLRHSRREVGGVQPRRVRPAAPDTKARLAGFIKEFTKRRRLKNEAEIAFDDQLQEDLVSEIIASSPLALEYANREELVKDITEIVLF